MKIYFAGSIRGGRDDIELYKAILSVLSSYGEVLTEHIGNSEISEKGEYIKNPKDVYKRDIDWIKESDLVVAEVSTPSLGVGYEVAYAESLGKKIICLHHLEDPSKISAMISGNDELELRSCKNIEGLKSLMQNFFAR